MTLCAAALGAAAFSAPAFAAEAVNGNPACDHSVCCGFATNAGAKADRVIEHDPEKWKPVFGQDHASAESESAMLIPPKSSRSEGPVRHCVSHKQLHAICGDPPTTNCEAELVGCTRPVCTSKDRK
jgi:hypothetical protein